MKSLISVIISIAVAILIIYFVCNFNDFMSFLEKIKRKIPNKILKIFSFLFIICFFIISFVIIFGYAKKIVNNIVYYKESQKNNEMFELCDNKIKEENKFYNEKIKLEYNNSNSQTPYIPDKFQYVEGNWNDGYVVQDENGNQFVWVPCTNKNNIDIIKLQKKNFVKNPYISKDICYNENYKEFVLSALENGGFYISRYEIGNENNIFVSKPNTEVWSNVTRNEAIEAVKTMYNSQNINCELINSYAYDTTLEWIYKTNNVNLEVVDKNEKIFTGRKQYNRIYDLFDNVLELTQETSYDTVVIRGFTKEDDEFKYTGNNLNEENRYTIFLNDNYANDFDVLSFRCILYK